MTRHPQRAGCGLAPVPPLLLMLAACGGGAPSPAQPIANTAEIVVLDPPPADALVLDVEALRWSCSIAYPRSVEARDLRVPVGRPIKLVVHTPEFPQWVTGIEVALVGTGVVKPVVYGKPVELAFRIDRPGRYAWKCPTLTPPRQTGDGELTAEARAQQDPTRPLYAMPAVEFDAFLAANTPTVPANLIALGRRLYEQKGCVACHTLDGTPRIGPSWAGIWGTLVTTADGQARRVDEAYIKASIRDPQAFARPGFPPAMPTFDGQLDERKLAALVALIASLADVKPAPAAP